MENADKVLSYWADAAFAALESMMAKREDPRNPAIAEAAAANLKILCKVEELTAPAAPAVSASAGMDWPAGDSGASYRSRHWASGHYANPSHGNSRGGSTISRMMDAADPSERRVLEKLLRETDI